MQNDSGKQNVWYVFVGLMVLFLLCTSMVACSVSVQFPSSVSAKPTIVGTPGTTQERQIAQAVFNAINKDREAAGLAPLQWSDALERSARQHNNAMMEAKQLARQVSGEADPGERERQQGVSWVVAAENIGFTEDISEHGVLALHQAMMAERPPDDGHRQNILSTQTDQLGVDVLFDSHNKRYWLTEDFAREA